MDRLLVMSITPYNWQTTKSRIIWCLRGNLWVNFALGIIANVPTAIPSSVTFRYYHMDHHIYQGVDTTDTDIPCDWELQTFTTAPLKLLWMICPLLVNPKPINRWKLFNAIFIFICDYYIYHFVGLWGFLYLFVGSLMGVGLHPAAVHFIAEHYVFVK
eukprot:481615_1